MSTERKRRLDEVEDLKKMRLKKMSADWRREAMEYARQLDWAFEDIISTNTVPKWKAMYWVMAKKLLPGQ